MNRTGCPICGYPNITVLDEHDCTTFEICPSCGSEAGYTFDTNTSEDHFQELRHDWLYQRGGKWFSTASFEKQPDGWNAADQLRKAGIPIPEVKKK